MNYVDPSGLFWWLFRKKKKSWEELAEEAVDAAQLALPGGEFVAALRVFDSCGSLGAVLAAVNARYLECFDEALFGDPKHNAAAEKACDDNWGAKRNLLRDTYEAHCKKMSCNVSIGMG